MSRCLLENLPRGIASGNPHDPSPGMAAGAAQVQARQRCAVLRGTRHRPDHEELIEGEFAMMPMAAADAKFLLDIERREQFRGDDAVAQSRRMPRQGVDAQVRETSALLRPAVLQRRSEE